MTLTYEPGGSLAHVLDPRTKLAVQAGFVAAAFAYTTPRGLVALTAVTAVFLLAARTSPLAALREVRLVLPLLVGAPLVEGVTLGAPWFVTADAVPPALASYRVLLVLFVSAAYVRTTPVRDSRAAIQRIVPGRPGQFLAMGVAFVFRFLPVLQADVGRIRDAQRARLGTERGTVERMQLLFVTAFNRALDRADRFALALRTRCFSWNPTLPKLHITWLDVPVLLVAAVLAGVALLAAV